MAGRNQDRSRSSKTAALKKNPFAGKAPAKASRRLERTPDSGGDLKARVVDTNALAIIVADTKLNMIYVNEAFQKMSGYCRDEVLGKNPRMLYSERNDHDLFKTLK